MDQPDFAYYTSRKEEIDKIKEVAVAFVDSVRASLNEQAKNLAASEYWAQGKKDGQLGIDRTSMNNFYVDAIENFVDCYSAPERIRLKKKLLQHYVDYKKHKVEFKREKDKYEQAHRELETLAAENKNENWFLSAGLYLVAALFLMLGEISLTVNVVQLMFNIHFTEKLQNVLDIITPWLVGLAIFCSTIFFKIFINEIVLTQRQASTNAGKPPSNGFSFNLSKKKAWLGFLFIGTLAVFFLLGLVRPQVLPLNSFKGSEQLLFILMAMIFPLVGSTCLVYGARYLRLVDLQETIKQNMEKISKHRDEMRRCRLHLLEIATELSIRESAYLNIVNALKNAYLHGVEEGRLTPECLPNSASMNSLYNLAKRSLGHDISVKLRQDRIDHEDLGSDGRLK